MGASVYPEAPASASKLPARRRGSSPSIVTLGVVAWLVLGVAWSRPAAAAGPTLDAKWRVASASVEGSTTELALTITLEKGWHVNANDPDRPYLIPTTLEIDAPAGVTVRSIRYPEPVLRALAFAPGAALRLYEGAFTIAVRVAGAPPGRFDATLGYQACTEETCLPPRTLAVPFDAARASGGAK